MSVTRRIVKNTVFLLGSGFISQGVGFLITLYLVRILTVGQFGWLSFALAFSAYFFLLGNLGLSVVGTRELAANRERANDVVRKVMTLRLLLSVGSLGVLLLTTVLLRQPFIVKLLIVIYGLGILPSALLMDWVFQAQERMAVIAVSRIATALVNLILVVMVVRSADQLLWVPSLAFIASLAGSAILLLALLRRGGSAQLRWAPAGGLDLLKAALPIGVSIFLIQMLYSLDTIILGLLGMDVAVGLYSAAFKIVFFVLFCGAFYYDAIFPVVCNYFHNDRPALPRLLAQTARLMISLALPIGVGGTMLAEPLMILFYGRSYAGAGAAFQILIWFAAIMYLNMIYDRGLWACGRYKTYLAIIAAEVVLNIAMNIFMIPRFGMIGAAFCKLAVILFGFVLYYRVFNGVVAAPFVPYLLRPALACLAMALALWGGLSLHWHVLFLTGLGGVVYVMVLWGIRGITRDDVQFIRSLIIKR